MCATAPRTNALNQVVRTTEYLEPTIPRAEQEAEVKSKLAALEQRHGRKPNVLIMFVDDLGYGDTGAYGGGEGVGSPTPNIDRLAREGLKADGDLRTTHLHADARGVDNWTFAHSQRLDLPDAVWRNDHRESVGR